MGMSERADASALEGPGAKGMGSNSHAFTADLYTGVTLRRVALMIEDGIATWVALS